MSDADKSNKTVAQEKGKNDAKPTLGAAYVASYADAAEVILLMILLATSAHASKALLRPLYGQFLSASWFRFGSFFSLVACYFLLPKGVNGIRASYILLSAILMAGPFTTRIVGRWAAENISDPSLSPVLSHLVLGYPVIGLGGAIWLRLMNQFVEPEVTQLGQVAVTAFTWFATENCIYWLDRVASDSLPIIDRIPAFPLLATLGVLAQALPVLTLRPTTDCSRSVMTVLTVSSLLSLGLSGRWAAPQELNGFKILFQNASTSGLVQVVDHHANTTWLRYLRNDARLLGGAWIDSDPNNIDVLNPAQEFLNRNLAMKDAVRLVEGPSAETALVIGTREGSVARLLMSHGYNTTLLERDELIYKAARQYFGLPEPNQVFVGDVEYWIWNQANDAHTADPSSSIPKYDVVIHDVFGGDVPPPTMFTLEFWSSVRTLMREDGVVAVSLLGKVDSATFKQTVVTLLTVFESCRIFHSGSAPTSSLSPRELTDFVIYCRPTGSLAFRVPNTSDFKGYPLHKNLFYSMEEEREIKIEDIPDDGSVPREKMVLKRADMWLNNFGKAFVVDYWKAARQLLPSAAWSMY